MLINREKNLNFRRNLLLKVIVVYESRYVNTKLVAETIVEAELPKCKVFGAAVATALTPAS
jgi:hypothetical protein